MRYSIMVGMIIVCAWTVHTGADPQQSSLDATVVDPQHFKIEFENEWVRVLRVQMTPGDTVLHEHPAPGGVVVYLTDVDMRQPSANGTSEDVHHKTGEVRWVGPTTTPHYDAAVHPFEVIRVEPKAR